MAQGQPIGRRLCGNAKSDWAAQKTNSWLILYKMAKKSLLINRLLASRVPEPRKLEKNDRNIVAESTLGP